MPLPTCRDMSELATDYMERALPWRVRLGAWRHLRVCSMCRAYYGQLAHLRRLVASFTLPGPSAATEDALLAARPPAGSAPP